MTPVLPAVRPRGAALELVFQKSGPVSQRGEKRNYAAIASYLSVSSNGVGITERGAYPGRLGLRQVINSWLEEISFRSGVIAVAAVLVFLAGVAAIGVLLGSGGSPAANAQARHVVKDSPRGLAPGSAAPSSAPHSRATAGVQPAPADAALSTTTGSTVTARQPSSAGGQAASSGAGAAPSPSPAQPAGPGGAGAPTWGPEGVPTWGPEGTSPWGWPSASWYPGSWYPGSWGGTGAGNPGDPGTRQHDGRGTAARHHHGRRP
jgi:hypothetical protein